MRCAWTYMYKLNIESGELHVHVTESLFRILQLD